MQGRDANKKLQRAIKAGKLRDKLPAMVQELRGLLAEWNDCEGEVRTGTVTVEESVKPRGWGLKEQAHRHSSVVYLRNRSVSLCTHPDL